MSDLTPLATLTSLQQLDCQETQVNDLTPLATLTSLQQLHCQETQVSDLTPLATLTSLQQLDCGGCTINEVPRALLDLTRKVHLYFHGTSIPQIPGEVLSQNAYDDCRQRLLDHLTDLEAGVEPVPDVKLIVIGNGRIGKTQICRRLCGEDFDPSVPSTHGISVLQTPLAVPEGQADILLNLWDFGGQDLYHGTHALFLKSRAVFLLVWTPGTERAEDYEYGGMRFRNQPLPYWLDYLRDAGGSHCTAVIVQNQCDEPQDEAPPADLSAYPDTWYVQQVLYSARHDRKRESLNEALREAVNHQRGHEGITTIGTGRMLVRQQLQTWIDEDSRRQPAHRRHRTLTQDEFQTLCEQTGHVASPDSLLDYLHNAGIVFYRKGLFRDEIILDQSWALDAIYSVFNREKCYRQLLQLGGRFTRPLLESLVWQDYSVQEQELFLSLMESCGICFTHRDGRRTHDTDRESEYIAPDLLPDREAVAGQLAGRWDDDGATVERAWDYDFLHPGLARSIISRVGQAAGDCAVYWKYGVWFYESTTRACAIVEQQMTDDSRGRIVLQTQGDRGNALLEHITEWITECQTQSGHAPCTVSGEPLDCADGRGGLPGRRRPSEHLRETDRDNDSSATPDLRITDPPRSPQPHVCVSYAWREERSSHPDRAGRVQEFCDRLKTAGREIIRDTDALRLGDRLSRFMRQIGNSDRIYIFLSDAYLKSPNCMYELLTIWQTSGDDPDRFQDRIRVYTMPGTDIYSIAARLEYAAHWNERYEDTREAI